jgi:hypothetical protein
VEREREKMIVRGTPMPLEKIAKLLHGFDLLPSAKDKRRAINRVIKFLEQYKVDLK